MAVIAVSLTCDSVGPSGPALGLYARSSASVYFEGRTLPLKGGDGIYDALPTSIRIGEKRSYEVDAQAARLRGTFRLERDSLFLDEVSGTVTNVALAGRILGDTLELRLFGMGAALGGPPDTDLRIRFVRKQ